MNIFKNIFRKKLQIEQLSKEDIALLPEGKFASLNSDDRIRVIMSRGDTGQNKNFDLLKFAIQSDPDVNVRFAALKRIHLFKEHPDLIPFLQSLNPYEKYRHLEPYLSMALSRVGLISREEFDRRINASDTKDRF